MLLHSLNVAQTKPEEFCYYYSGSFLKECYASKLKMEKPLQNMRILNPVINSGNMLNIKNFKIKLSSMPFQNKFLPLGSWGNDLKQLS